MDSSITLTRLGGYLLLLAGVLLMVFWLVHPDPSLENLSEIWTLQWKIAYGIFIAALFLSLFGLIGAFLWFAGQARVIDLLALVFGYLGTVVLLGFLFIQGFIVPLLDQYSDSASLINSQGFFFDPNLTWVFWTGGGMLAACYIFLGLRFLRQNSHVNYFSLFMIVGAPLLLASPVLPTYLRVLSFIIFGIGMAFLGNILLTELSPEVARFIPAASSSGPREENNFGVVDLKEESKGLLRRQVLIPALAVLVVAVLAFLLVSQWDHWNIARWFEWSRESDEIEQSPLSNLSRISKTDQEIPASETVRPPAEAETRESVASVSGQTTPQPRTGGGEWLQILLASLATSGYWVARKIRN